MRRWLPLPAALATVLVALAALTQITPPGYTRCQLSDPDGGRTVRAAVLANCQPMTLTWHNSLFEMPVQEVFYADEGRLVLDRVAFVDPAGGYRMPVAPADVADLYHTGGAFSTTGLARPYQQVIFRIGEIGDPRISVGGREVALEQEVGFGGRVRLDARRATALEIVRHSFR